MWAVRKLAHWCYSDCYMGEHMCVVEIFCHDVHNLWMTNTWGGDMSLGIIFHEESFGDVSRDVGHWHL